MQVVNVKQAAHEKPPLVIIIKPCSHRPIAK